MSNATLSGGSQLSCAVLSASNPCGPAFAGWPMLKDSLNQYGFSDEAALAAALAQVAPANASNFVGNERGCTPSQLLDSAVASMRYQASFLCADIVRNAITGINGLIPLKCSSGQASDPGAVIMCPGLCQVATSTYQNVFTNAKCAANPTWLAQKISTRNTDCDSMDAVLATSSAGQHCLFGLASEFPNCGFATKVARDSHCLANSNDFCCSAPTSGFDGYLVYDGKQYGYPGSATPSSNSGAVIGGAIGGVIAAVLIAVVVWYFCFRGATKQRASESGFAATSLPEKGSLPRSRPVEPSVPEAAITLGPVGSLGRPKPPTIAAAQRENREIVHVVHSYATQAPDELDLREGDDLICLKRFDDGWALGMQPASGRQGVFPLVCVCSLAEAQSAKHGGGAITAARLSKRMSSASSVLSLTMSSHQTATQSPGPMPQQQFEKVYVLFGYDATQDDELTLVPGKEVLLLRRFDDGWGLAMSPITAKKGAIPLVCVGTKEQLTASLIGDRASVMTGISKRASSYLQVQ